MRVLRHSLSLISVGPCHIFSEALDLNIDTLSASEPHVEGDVRVQESISVI